MKIITFDIETDPFKFGVKPEPFLAGICDGEKCIQWWGDNCIESFIAWLAEQKEKCIVYAHNGGKFDFFYLPWPVQNPKIINGRIAKCKLGIHEFRDSYLIYPFAMASYNKDEIDYGTFERSEREKHKAKIMVYHRGDLIYTREVVTGFIERFGKKLTAPGAAIEQLNLIHPVERKTESHDAQFRDWLFGGRVECFKLGMLSGNWKVYDVNSMYPYAMARYSHPTGKMYEFTTDFNSLKNKNAVGFAKITAKSKGAFPLRAENGRLEFPHGVFEFNVTLHELHAALDLGLCDVYEVHAGYISEDNQSFGEYVAYWYQEKISAKKTGDKLSEQFAKLMLNSCWGKFASNPENYFDYDFLLEGERIPDDWEIDEDHGWMLVIKRPSPIRFASYYDVATGASITGAARAILMRAIHGAKNPIYCDTDSLICESLPGADKISEYGLGDWKLEGQGDTAIILGKKLYCVTNGGSVIKKANKGVNFQLKDFIGLYEKGEVISIRDAPNFNKAGLARFTQRKITFKGTNK